MPGGAAHDGRRQGRALVKMQWRRWLAVAVAAGRLGAAGAADLSEDMYFSEWPVVLTASRIAQSPLDAPAPVTVIDRETIQASGFTEVHDLFRLVPGFLVADRPTGAPAVANHAMGSAYPHNLLVLLDGRSLVDPVTGSVEWMDLPVRPEDIERIEVVRGPNQASYGAAAFNGVVNIITRAPGEDAGGGLVWSRGQRDFGDAYLRYARRGDAVDWRLSLSDRSTTPFRDLAQPYYPRHETNDRQTLRAAATWRAAQDREIDLDVGLMRGRDRVGSTLYGDEEPYRNKDVESRFFQLAWHASYGYGSEWSLRYYHYDRAQREAFVHTGTGLAVPMDLGFETGRDDVELQQTHVFSDRLTALWGAGVRGDQAKSAHYFYGLGTVSGTQWQLFGNLDWRIAPDWLLHAGAMVERHYRTDTLVSPRLALNHALGPRQGLRVSAGRGYRAPTVLESDANETYTYQGHPVFMGLLSLVPLEPERADFVELGYFGRFPGAGLQVDARLYAERYGRLIQARTCYMDSLGQIPGPKVEVTDCQFVPPEGYLAIFEPYKAVLYVNTGEARVYGGELALDWRHAEVGRVRVAYAQTRVEAGADADNDIPKSAPRHSASLLWSRDLPWGLAASLGYYRVGDMYWLGDGDRQPAYDKVDVRLAKRFGKPGSGDEIALTVWNLDGEHFEFRSGHSGSYSERQAFVTLRLGW